MPARSGPFYVYEIARALSGQERLDPFLDDESRRIAQDMFERFERGEFEEQDLFLRYGDPPRFGPIAEARAARISVWLPGVKTSFQTWHGAVALSYAAAKRYVEQCGLPRAHRVLNEWFTSTTPGTRYDQFSKMRDAPRRSSVQFHRALPRRRRGPEPKKRLATEAAMKRDIVTGAMTIEALDKLKEKVMAARYRVARDTARNARRNVLSELDESRQLRQSSTIDK